MLISEVKKEGQKEGEPHPAFLEQEEDSELNSHWEPQKETLERQ